jgi:hypothetical protein
MCDNSDFCKRHSNNWELMHQELASYLRADHFPQSQEEIQQFFVPSTVDAAILFHINYIRRRPETWRNLFQDPLKWSQLYIFSKMKSSIKSTRRYIVLRHLLDYDKSHSPKDRLKSVIYSLGGIDKA